MYFLVKCPEIVEQYSPSYEDLFSVEGYRYFRRYISGLLVSENKTLEAINRLFIIEKRNQSSFNRFVNGQHFDIEMINKRRLAFMQQNEGTCFKTLSTNQGVLSLDDTLLSHYGSHMEHIYNLYDHVHKHYTLAHNLVSLYYSDDQTDYPVFQDLWIPADWESIALKMKDLGIHINEQKWEQRQSNPQKWRNYMRDRFRDYKEKHPDLKVLYDTKLDIGLSLLRQFGKQYPNVNLPVAMDSGYTAADLCQAIDQELNMTYVGSLADYQIVVLSGGEEVTLADFTKRLIEQHKQHKNPENTVEPKFFKTSVHYKGRTDTFYAYCANHKLKGYSKKQRLVISFKEKDLTDVPRYSISNRLNWFASQILRVRRHRWPVETYHQEGKEEGLDKYQLRDFGAIKTHIAFVSIAYSMLKYAKHDPKLLSMLRQRLDTEPIGSLPFLRKIVQADCIVHLIEFIFLNYQLGKSIQDITAQIVPNAVR